MSDPLRTSETAQTPARGSPLEVLRVATKLGLTSFGGPVAHLGYFHEEYVVRREWVSEQTYADLVALSQFLPGPASSELGIAIGIERAGLPGGLAAWLGFTVPSAVALTAFASFISHAGVSSGGWVHGLQIVAVAVVAQAVWQMARRFLVSRTRVAFAVVAAAVLLVWSTAASQIVVIAAAALAGWWLLPSGEQASGTPMPSPIGRRTAIAAWVAFVALLLGLPLLHELDPNGPLAVADSFYRTGALVFGGGHVVLPLLQAAVVSPGWVTERQFTAGYGAAQAIPGPLFTFSAYLGFIMRPAPHGVAGAGLALVSIFLPAGLLVVGTMRFWNRLRANAGFRAALNGVNAAVVGLLLAALYHPVWTTAIGSVADVVIALLAFGLLQWWRLPPWSVVLFAGISSALWQALR